MACEVFGCVDTIEELENIAPTGNETHGCHIFSDEAAIIASIEADLKWNTRKISEEELGLAILEAITDEYFGYEEALSAAYIQYLLWFAGNTMSNDWYRSDIGKLVRDTIFICDIQGIMTLERFNEAFGEVWLEYEAKKIYESEEK